MTDWYTQSLVLSLSTYSLKPNLRQGLSQEQERQTIRSLSPGGFWCPPTLSWVHICVWQPLSPGACHWASHPHPVPSLLSFSWCEGRYTGCSVSRTSLLSSKTSPKDKNKQGNWNIALENSYMIPSTPQNRKKILNRKEGRNGGLEEKRHETYTE
jgi:hypothetical protein